MIVSVEIYGLRASGGFDGKQLSACVEIVWIRLNVVASGGKEGGVERGRDGRGEGGNEEKRLIGEREVTPLAALESARSLPVIPV